MSSERSSSPIPEQPPAKVQKLNDEDEAAKAARVEFTKLTVEIFEKIKETWKSRWCGRNTFGGTFDFNGETLKAYMIGTDGKTALEFQYKIDSSDVE